MIDTPRVAVITGANRGIGLAVAKAMQEYGIFTILTARNVNNFSDVIDEMDPNWCHFRELDVTDENSIATFCQLIRNDYTRLDILINNAGVYLDDETQLRNLDLSIFDQTLKTNVYGPLSLAQKLLPMMEKNKYGRIVNVSSGMGAHDAFDDNQAPSYKISKQALNSVTKLMAREVDSKQIKINAICPGWVRTRMGGPTAPRSVEQAVQGIMWAATIEADGPTGGFFRDGKTIQW